VYYVFLLYAPVTVETKATAGSAWDWGRAFCPSIPVTGCKQSNGNMGLQCWSYVATNKGPIFTSNIGPILSSCELSVIGPIFLAIFSQYWVEYL